MHKDFQLKVETDILGFVKTKCVIPVHGNNKKSLYFDENWSFFSRNSTPLLEYPQQTEMRYAYVL